MRVEPPVSATVRCDAYVGASRARIGTDRLDRPIDQTAIDGHVLLSHPCHVEVGLKGMTAVTSIEPLQATNRGNCIVNTVDDESRDAVLNDLGDRALAPRNDGGVAGGG